MARLKVWLYVEYVDHEHDIYRDLLEPRDIYVSESIKDIAWYVSYRCDGESPDSIEEEILSSLDETEKQKLLS